MCKLLVKAFLTYDRGSDFSSDPLSFLLYLKSLFGDIALENHTVEAVSVCHSLFVRGADRPSEGRDTEKLAKQAKGDAPEVLMVVRHERRTADTVGNEHLQQEIQGLSVFFIGIVLMRKYAVGGVF